MKGDVLKAVFALAVIVQVVLFGIPEGATASQATGLDTVFQPITDVVWGIAIYAFRALGITIVAALVLRGM